MRTVFVLRLQEVRPLNAYSVNSDFLCSLMAKYTQETIDRSPTTAPNRLGRLGEFISRFHSPKAVDPRARTRRIPPSGKFDDRKAYSRCQAVYCLTGMGGHPVRSCSCKWASCSWLTAIGRGIHEGWALNAMAAAAPRADSSCAEEVSEHGDRGMNCRSKNSWYGRWSSWRHRPKETQNKKHSTSSKFAT